MYYRHIRYSACTMYIITTVLVHIFEALNTASRILKILQ